VFEPHAGTLADVSQEERSLCDAIRTQLLDDPRVKNCSNVTLLKIGDSYNLTLTLHIQKEKSLDEVHAIIARIESELYQQYKQLRRVTIHAEPSGAL
jgi:divalent metal cation (Fe/Co/Zn/Cd) transporter